MKSCQMKKRIHLSIAVSLIFLLVMIAGCKSQGNGILPVVPDQPVIPERIINPNDYNSRIGRLDDTLNIRFEITGPAQYLSSELDPPQITEIRPVFSARLINIPSEPSSSDFDAFIDYKKVFFNFIPLSNEISFTPTDAFKDGKHTASLIYKNQNGSNCACFWSFEIVTKPPEISLVLRTQVDDHLVVMFDRPVEPSQFKDTTRWMVNGRRGVLRSNIQYEVGSMIVFLPLNNLEFSLFESKVGPLTLSFASDQGMSDYVIRRVGEERRVQDNPCWGHCNEIEIHFDEEHHSLETEDYGFCYRVHQPIPGWCLEVLWAGWQITPVKNDDPSLNYDQDQDNSTVDATLIGLPGMSHPLVMLPWAGTDEDGHTIKVPRQYFHSFSIEYWGDCNDGERPDGSDFETKLAEKSYNFSSGTDISNPVFINEPTVLYGDEAADLITTWMQTIPMLGEAVSGDVYCYSMSRDYMNDWLSFQLRDHACDLFIVARIADPLGAGYGFINQNFVSLDRKFTDPSTGQITYDFGPLHGDQYFGISMDHHPWGGRHEENLPIEDLELDPEWPDEDEPGMIRDGGYNQDWTPEEDFIYFINLTDILMAGSGENITGLRVRVTDNAGGPGSPHPGNWIRSDNVMEQLCNTLFIPERGGSSGETFYPCQHELKAEFIGKNPHDYTPSNDEFKIIEFNAVCNENSTNFIIQMGQVQGYESTNWGAEIEIAAYLDFDDSAKLNPCKFPPPFIEAHVKSSEDTARTGKDNETSTFLFNMALNPDTGVTIERLCELFGVPPDQEECECHFYVGKLLVSDDIDETTFGELYLSNSDHKIPEGPRRRDCALTVSTKHIEDAKVKKDVDVAPSSLHFGTLHGIGWEQPSEPTDDIKYWYNYDDYIKRAGFETVSAISFSYIDDNLEDVYLNFHGGILDSGVRNIPIESSGDVLVIKAHGLTFDFPSSVLGYFDAPEHHDPNLFSNPPMEPDPNALRNSKWFCIGSDPSYAGKGYTIPPNKGIPNDFYTSFPDSIFWCKNPEPDIEPRWLLALGCSALQYHIIISDGGHYGSVNPYQPRRRLKEIIDGGSIVSACGFKGISTNWYANKLMQVYSDIMNDIADNPQPGGWYYKTPQLYQNYYYFGDYYDFPRDPSVASFMEACVQLTKLDNDNNSLSSPYVTNCIDWACGIHKDTGYAPSEEWQSFHIIYSDDPIRFGYFWKRQSFNYQIIRRVFEYDTLRQEN
jgi:hypothetical protein